MCNSGWVGADEGDGNRCLNTAEEEAERAADCQKLTHVVRLISRNVLECIVGMKRTVTVICGSV